MTLDEIREQLEKDIEKAKLDSWSADRNEDCPGACSFTGVAEGLRRALGYLEKLAVLDVPCRVGDTLWCLVDFDCSTVMPMTVENVFINKMVSIVGLSGFGTYKEILCDDIGKIAFWSEEEAIAVKEECLKVVDDILESATVHSEQLYKEYASGVLEAFDKGGSGLLDDY